MDQTKNLSDLARSLRKNMTRQKVIGPYIVDFYIAGKRLVIELDGSQHYSIPGKQADTVRDGYLREQGLTVLRYSNADVDRDFPGVCGDILAHLQNN